MSVIMHGEKKDNLLGEKTFQETFDEIKSNQKSLIDSTSCNKPEQKVRSCKRLWFGMDFSVFDYTTSRRH